MQEELVKRALEEIKRKGGKIREDYAMGGESTTSPRDLHSLIDRTLHEINKFWQKGLLNWIKLTHPKEWSEILNLEEKINTLVFEGDEKGLSEFLTKYRDLFLELSREYSKIKGERR
jgi:hypothetical protein